MAVAEHVDGVFLAGLSLFILGIVIIVILTIWSFAGWAERKLR